MDVYKCIHCSKMFGSEASCASTSRSARPPA